MPRIRFENRFLIVIIAPSLMFCMRHWVMLVVNVPERFVVVDQVLALQYKLVMFSDDI